MTTNNQSDDEMATPQEFKSSLEVLLQRAMASDIDPRGSWVYRPDTSDTDFEVMVVELEAQSGSD